METLLITVVTAVLTVVSPLAIAWAKRDSWSKLLKVGVPIVVSVALAALYVTLRGQLVLVTVEDYLNAFLIIYGIQQLLYTTILRWWAGVLEKVGNETAGDVTISGPAPTGNITINANGEITTDTIEKAARSHAKHSL
jgi:hypothetical protein